MSVAVPVAAPVVVSVAQGQWSSGICDLCGSGEKCEAGTFFMGLLCSCCLYGSIVSGLNGGHGYCGACCCFCCCRAFSCCCIHNETRGKMRAMYGNLPPEPCNDCLTTWFCSACALCQEKRELDFRTGGSGVMPVSPTGMVVVQASPAGQAMEMQPQPQYAQQAQYVQGQQSPQQGQQMMR